jgi:hypothetical protein
MKSFIIYVPLWNDIRMIKSRRINWTPMCHGVEEMKNIFFAAPEGRRPLGRSRRRETCVDMVLNL